MLTTTGNIYRRESANMEFQEALNKACLADPKYRRSSNVTFLAKISSATGKNRSTRMIVV